MIKTIDKCRICDNSDLVPVVDLGDQYLTGVFPKTKESNNLTKGPLKLVKCQENEKSCGLLQLQNSYDLKELYGDNYGYRSGLNSSMVNHLKNKISNIQKIANLKSNDLIIDIGSNDGTTLSFYSPELHLVGIDPTALRFKEYYQSNINIISDFFSSELINSRYPGKKAKIITSFAMFYDLESPIDFVKQIAEVLDPKEGIWIFEQSYMPSMLNQVAYDTICHEHLEYYALRQILWLTASVGLKVIDVELNDVNGGSFSVMATHKESKYIQNEKIISKIVKLEEEMKISNLKTYKSFSEKIEQNRDSLKKFIDKEKKIGKRICGLGASTKGNVILQYCELGPEDIEVIGDVNLDKHGTVTPGTWIPIQSEESVLASNPDNLIILPWHFKDFFIKSKKFIDRKLITPLPRLQIFYPKKNN